MAFWNCVGTDMVYGNIGGDAIASWTFGTWNGGAVMALWTCGTCAGNPIMVFGICGIFVRTGGDVMTFWTCVGICTGMLYRNAGNVFEIFGI